MPVQKQVTVERQRRFGGAVGLRLTPFDLKLGKQAQSHIRDLNRRLHQVAATLGGGEG